MIFDLIVKDEKDNIIDESTIQMEEGDKIIATIQFVDGRPLPTNTIAKQVYHLKEWLTGGSKLIVIPEWIKLSVLKVSL